MDDLHGGEAATQVPSRRGLHLVPAMEALLTGVTACVFDFDGTLVDTAGIWEEVDDQFFGRRGLQRPADHYERVAGLSARETADFLIREYGLAESPEDVMSELETTHNELFCQRARYVSGAPAFLRLLHSRGVRLGIATASPQELVERYFQLHPEGRELFEAVVSVDAVGKSKPAPDVYLECMRRLGAEPGSSVVFEDSVAGLRGARAAGGHVVCLFTNGAKAAEKEELSDLLAADYACLVELD